MHKEGGGSTGGLFRNRAAQQAAAVTQSWDAHVGRLDEVMVGEVFPVSAGLFVVESRGQAPYALANSLRCWRFVIKEFENFLWQHWP